MNSRGGGGTTAASIANSPLIKRVPQSECSAEAGAWEVRAAGRMLIAVLVRPCNTPTAPPASSRWLGFPDQAQHGLPADIHPHVAENVPLGSLMPSTCTAGKCEATDIVPCCEGTEQPQTRPSVQIVSLVGSSLLGLRRDFNQAGSMQARQASAISLRTSLCSGIFFASCSHSSAYLR